MAKFAPVAPVHLLEAFKIYGELGNYHLLLAHDILKHKEEYSRVFDTSINAIFGSTPDRTIILDNSVIELGTAVEIETILEAAEVTKPTVIVLPDILGDSEGTIQLGHLALVDWTYKLDKVLGVGRWTYMVVPQGRTLSEFVWCAQQFKDNPNIGWWSVPRHMTAKLGSRQEAAKLLNILNPSKKIHLLGFSDNILDDILTAHLPFVTGIDSAVPIRAASHSIPFEPVMRNLPPRGNWWDAESWNAYNALMLENLKKARSIFRLPSQTITYAIGDLLTGSGGYNGGASASGGNGSGRSAGVIKHA